MPIAKITGQGLIAIALSVAFLWTCLIGERVVSKRAHLERARLMQEIEVFQQRQRIQPVSAPARINPIRIRMTAG